MGNFSGRVSSSPTFRVPTTRPKVFNATLPHLSVARDHCRRPSREQNMPSRSRDALADPPVSRMRLFAHETTLEDPSVSRTRRSAHETTLADSPVSRTRRLAFRQGQLRLVQSDLRHVYRLGLHRHSAGAGLALRRRGDGRGAGLEALDGAGLVNSGDAPVGRRPAHYPVGRGFGRDPGGQCGRSALNDLDPGRGDGHG